MKGRPPLSERTFHCQLAEDKLQQILPIIHDVDLKRMFAQCWMSSLDTTVFAHDGDLGEKDHAKARPASWVITGDIPALWLRDSANQMAAYVSLLAEPSSSSYDWTALYRLILGTLYSQAACISLHPFSNAFIPPTSPVEPSNTDRVHPPLPSSSATSPGIRVWETKWEVDSVASFLDLSVRLMTASGRHDPLRNRIWREAVALVIRVCRLQQRGTDEEEELLGPPRYGAPEQGEERPAEWSWKGEGRYEGKEGVYRFQRHDWASSETRALRGLGEPGRRCGLVKSAFRPSDDSTVLPFLIPSNAFLSVGLIALSDIIDEAVACDDFEDEYEAADLQGELKTLSSDLRCLGEEVRDAVWKYGAVTVRSGEEEERVFAYEVDGLGSYLIADDANLPSLISLPHLGFVPFSNPMYHSTRALLLSPRNKWFFTGKVASGIGGMHIGSGFIWPMSIIAQALTSEEDEEILDCLAALRRSTAGTGFIHESFHADNASNYTRAWFAWANGLFGQLVLQLAEDRPYLL